jgi:hypothetical protein
MAIRMAADTSRARASATPGSQYEPIAGSSGAMPDVTHGVDQNGMSVLRSRRSR